MKTSSPYTTWNFIDLEVKEFEQTPCYRNINTKLWQIPTSYLKIHNDIGKQVPYWGPVVIHKSAEYANKQVLP